MYYRRGEVHEIMALWTDPFNNVHHKQFRLFFKLFLGGSEIWKCKKTQNSYAAILYKELVLTGSVLCLMHMPKVCLVSLADKEDVLLCSNPLKQH